MYISKDYHILSGALLKAALVNIACIFMVASIRFIFREDVEATPDMNKLGFGIVGIVAAVVRVLCTTFIFIGTIEKLKRLSDVTENVGELEAGRYDTGEGDNDDKPRFQKDYDPEKVSELNTHRLYQMLQIWGVVLVAANLMQEFCSLMYQKSFNQLELYAYSGNIGVDTIALYNVTHGFKYIGMITAVIIGFFVTGVFLNDKKMMIASAFLMLAYTVAFGLLQMFTLELGGKSMGIVWTGLIYHMTNTFGIMGFAIYIRKKHRC